MDPVGTKSDAISAGVHRLQRLMSSRRVASRLAETAGVERIVKRRPELAKDTQVGFLAINKRGDVGAWAIQKGFSYAVCDAKKQDALIPARSTY